MLFLQQRHKEKIISHGQNKQKSGTNNEKKRRDETRRDETRRDQMRIIIRVEDRETTSYE